MDSSMVTTTFSREGYRVVRHLGVVRGITEDGALLLDHAGAITRVSAGEVTLRG